MAKQPAVYIVTNKMNGTLYTGVTSDLVKRIYQHKNEHSLGFTKIYNCKMLVYYELPDSMMSAIEREKLIKGGGRLAKLMLINETNPNWNDLYDSIL